MRIGLDIDDCIVDFWGSYCKRFTNPNDLKQESINKNLYRILRTDRDFWINLPLINYPNFIPELYCTKRINSKEYTKESFRKHNLPQSPIFQLYTHSGRKSVLIKGRVDVFIDDSIDNFLEINKSGIPCLLFNTDNNKYFNTIGRIYKLDYNEIVNVYNSFIIYEFNIIK